MSPTQIIPPFLVSFLIMSYLGLPVHFRHLAAILLPLPAALWSNPWKTAGSYWTSGAGSRT